MNKIYFFIESKDLKTNPHEYNISMLCACIMDSNLKR